MQEQIQSIIQTADQIEGHLSYKEMEFLAINAAVPTAKGCVLEIGSYKGKSTYLIAEASKLAGDDRIVAVDPLTTESLADHYLKGDVDEVEFQHDFFKNLEQFHIRERVEFFQMYSYEMVKTFQGSIRFLWIDGDHTYEGVKRDVALFTPFLSDGAIIAMHDVLHNLDGPVRCFNEDVLQSPNFGRAGLCGSIGWGRYHSDVKVNEVYLKEKEELHQKLTELIPFSTQGKNQSKWNAMKYKWYRTQVPHGRISLEEWRKMIEQLECL